MKRIQSVDQLEASIKSVDQSEDSIKSVDQSEASIYYRACQAEGVTSATQRIQGLVRL